MKKTSVRFVVTAGPTREYLDPVRFLSNPSTGKMGFAIAAAAARCGFETTLVAGPVALKTPARVTRVDVTSAREMLAAVGQAVAGMGDLVLVSSAAVADWRPARCAATKLKKRQMSGVLRLVRNPDILKTIARKLRGSSSSGRRIVLVGFAAETGEPTAEAVRKCREKKLDLIVANDVTEPGCGFGTETNRVILQFANGRRRPLPLLTKAGVARELVRTITALLAGGAR